MLDARSSLIHHNHTHDGDDVLARDARQFLLKIPPVQLIGELLRELRVLSPSWWSPELLRTWWPASVRMGWFEQRPDIRQRITSKLAGLPPKAARKCTPYFQAELIDAVLNEGDVSLHDFEASFDPLEMAIYGPANQIWQRFRHELPLYEDAQTLRAFMAWLLDSLITDKSAVEGVKRRPIISSLQMRSAIDGHIWHTMMPLELRVGIDEARFRQERTRPGRPFSARHDLQIAMPEHIAAHLPLSELSSVLDCAEKAMEFGETSVQENLPLPEPSATGFSSVPVARQSGAVPTVSVAVRRPLPPPVTPARHVA